MTESPFMQEARRYLAVLHKRRLVVMASLGLSMVVAVLYNYTARPLYQASAQILIAKAAPRMLPTKDLMDQGVDDYRTEYELLRGRALAEKLVERLQLRNHPELSTGPLFTPWERFLRLVGRYEAPVIDGDGVPLSPAAAAVRSRLTLEPLPGGRLVNLRFTTYNPQIAATMANTLAELYIEQSVALRTGTSSEATDWLSQQLGEQKKKIEAAEKTLLEYQQRHGLVDVQDDGAPDDDPLTALEQGIMAARMERIAKQGVVEQARRLSPVELGNLPAVAALPGVREARARVAESSAEIGRLGQTLGDRHPDMIRAQGQLAEAQQALEAELRGAVRALAAEHQLAASREATLQASLDRARQQRLQTSGQAIEYHALRREVESNRQVYASLLSRSKETGLESELTASGVRVVEKAEVPRGPVSPRRTRNYQIALLVGLLLGVGLALLFEHADNSVKTPEDVKELGLAFLGMVPRVEDTPNALAVLTSASRMPTSALGEAYRVIRTNLVFACPGEGGKVILTTSANPGEGKTTTTAHLAAALALTGARVLVIDADLRRPALHRQFRLEKTPGLSDLIVGRCQASEAIRGTTVSRLNVLPSGYSAPNPAELLGSSRMREIVTAVRQHYDWVLIDTPPVLAMADTPALCPLVDGAVLIISSEESPRPAVQRAVEQVVRVGGKVAGAVLNHVDLRRNAYYYGHHYGEYYRRYYGKTPLTARPGARAGSRGDRPFRA